MKIPFDIKYRPQIESGEYKVETKDEKQVRIVSWDKNGFECKEIVALVTNATGTESCNVYTIDGLLRSNYCQKNMNLFIVTPKKELTEFEEELENFYNHHLHVCTYDNQGTVEDSLHDGASKLLSIAREQFIKDGYVIEKKAFHDAVKKVDPKVMKEVSEKWDAMKEALRLEYEKGRADALKDFEAQCQSSVDNTHGLPYELGFKAGKKAGYEVGKYDTLKDLPIWKRIRDIDDLAFIENDIKLDKVIICPNKEGRMYYTYRTDLFEKLPKEDK